MIQGGGGCANTTQSQVQCHAKFHISLSHSPTVHQHIKSCMVYMVHVCVCGGRGVCQNVPYAVGFWVICNIVVVKNEMNFAFLSE